MAFGWCNTNHHDQCIVKYQRWYMGSKKVKRKTVEAIVYLDEWRECDCHCHKPEQPKKHAAKKTTRRRKKL